MEVRHPQEVWAALAHFEPETAGAPVSLPYIIDGETDADSTVVNTWIDRINGLNDGTVPIALPGIAGALGEYEPLVNMEALWSDARSAGVLPGTGSNDVTSYLQDLIDDGGGVVALPPHPKNTYYLISAPLVPKPNQTILGAGLPYTSNDGPLTRIHTSYNGPVFATDGVSNVTLRGLALTGLGETTPLSEGVHIENGSLWNIEFCKFNNFGRHAIFWDGGAAGYIHRNLAINCMKYRSGHTDYVGVFDIGDVSDLFVSNNEANAGSSAANYDTGFICSLRYAGGNGFFNSNVWEFGEVGACLDTGAWITTFVNDRADVNTGHGWLIKGQKCRLIGCRSHRNSQRANDTDDAYRVTGNRNSLIACVSDDESSDTKRVKYALNDQSSASGTNVNQYALNRFRGYATAEKNFAGAADGYLDLFARPTVTGASDSDKIDSVIAALVSLGIAVDGTT